MKKMLLSFVTLLTLSTTFAQVQYTNYGESWLISMDKRVPIDVNEDGINDFFVNTINGTIGFEAISLVGCFPSPNFEYNNLNTRIIQTHEVGETIQISNANMYDYIDDGKASVYSETQGFAEGWANLEDRYIGFAVFVGNVVLDGWMKVALYHEAKAIFIKEIAYVEGVYSSPDGGVVVGDTGAITSTNELNESLNAVMLTPNPAKDNVTIQYNYSGSKNLSIVIQNAIGQTVYSLENANKGQHYFDLNVSDWTNGMCLLQFRTDEGVRTEKLIIQR